MSKKTKCLHRMLFVKREKDGCHWVECYYCGKKGPKKHSYLLAVICWATTTVNQHPRVK